MEQHNPFQPGPDGPESNGVMSGLNADQGAMGWTMGSGVGNMVKDSGETFPAGGGSAA